MTYALAYVVFFVVTLQPKVAKNTKQAQNYGTTN